MITFTTLAESKCDLLSSRHTTPAPGSSTSTATKETRSRRAASTARLILPASAGWEDDAQMPGAAPAVLDAAPAGPAKDTINGIVSRTDTDAPLGFNEGPLRPRRMRPLSPIVRMGCGPDYSRTGSADLTWPLGPAPA